MTTCDLVTILQRRLFNLLHKIIPFSVDIMRYWQFLQRPKLSLNRDYFVLGLSFKHRITVLKCLQSLRRFDYMTDFSCQMQQQSFVIDADTCIDGFKQAIFKVANFLVLMYCTASIPIFISIWFRWSDLRDRNYIRGFTRFGIKLL